jgi:dephospho-CoA kinase
MYCYGIGMVAVSILSRITLKNQYNFSTRSLIAMASVLAVSRVQGLATLSTLQVGLTGSIGMGKSTCTKHFRAMGFPVFDADAAVNELYSAGGAAVDPIGKLFPDAIIDSAVSRPVLGKKVIEDSKIWKILEDIVHPLVSAKRRQFFEKAKSEGHFMVIYDIPLLLENPASHEVDYTIVVTADADVQKERVLMRPGMTEEKFISILSKQMPDKKKREQADFLILTDFAGFAPGRSQVANVVEKIIEKNPALWAAWKTQSLGVEEQRNVVRGVFLLKLTVFCKLFPVNEVVFVYLFFFYDNFVASLLILHISLF